MLLSGVAQPRKKPVVTLTLDADVRAAADELLAQLPTRVSLSSLVEQLLREFVATVGPVLGQLDDASPADRVRILHELGGTQVLRVAEALGEAVTAAKGSQPGRE